MAECHVLELRLQLPSTLDRVLVYTALAMTPGSGANVRKRPSGGVIQGSMRVFPPPFQKHRRRSSVAVLVPLCVHHVQYCGDVS